MATLEDNKNYHHVEKMIPIPMIKLEKFHFDIL